VTRRSEIPPIRKEQNPLVLPLPESKQKSDETPRTERANNIEMIRVPTGVHTATEIRKDIVASSEKTQRYEGTLSALTFRVIACNQ